MPGRGHSKKWWRGYHKLRVGGKSKKSAARIMNANKTKKTKRKRR